MDRYESETSLRREDVSQRKEPKERKKKKSRSEKYVSTSSATHVDVGVGRVVASCLKKKGGRLSLSYWRIRL